MRLSNFLPWQTAYAEMIFNPVYWPDYDRGTFLGDLNTYASRDRRFGGVRKI
jgi:undecaprenyl diphosphate synthase